MLIYLYILPSKTVNVWLANPLTTPSIVTEYVIVCSPVLNVEVSMRYGEEPKQRQ